MLSTRTTSCIVVEARRGAGVKLTYDPDVGTLTVTSARALGITYMPGTVSTTSPAWPCSTFSSRTPSAPQRFRKLWGRTREVLLGVDAMLPLALIRSFLAR